MPQYFDFEVTLKHIDPPIWRRFLLTADDTTFMDLHGAIQDADTWLNMHLWQFQEEAWRGRVLAQLSPDEEMGMDVDDQDAPAADEVTLSTYFTAEGDRCVYLYDYGDGWEHEVVLKRIVDKPETFYRRLIDGQRAFPPEDCGGPPGYEMCLALVGSPSAAKVDFSDFDEQEMEDRREWVGDWDPEEFDLEQAREWFDGDTRRQVAENQEAILDELDREMDEIEREWDGRDASG